MQKLKKIFSVKIKRVGLCSEDGIPCNCQKGSILIGLIITMVVMSLLGAGMVYLTSTSTFQEVFANNHARAYYVAESGGRYALSVIRDAYATDKTKLNAINNNQTFTLASNGGQFQITNFLQDGLDPETITFDSIGTVNSGFLQARRQLTYRVQTANQSGGATASGPAGPINFTDYTPTSLPDGSSSGISILSGGQGVNLNLAAGGLGKQARVLYNTAWHYSGDYNLQIKATRSGGGANQRWNMGLFFNFQTNGSAVPFGYGISYFHSWTDKDIDPLIKNIMPSLPTGQPISPVILLWQNVPGTGFDWIAYAPLDNTAIANILSTLDTATIVVRVTRNATPAYNDIEVYFGAPSPTSLGDEIPTNNTRMNYLQWVTPANDIKWPSFNGSWPPSNDYFTMVNSNITSPTVPPSLPIAKWVRNTNANITATTTFQPDTTTITGTSIPNAIIRSTVLTGSNYSGVGLFMDANANPQGVFYDFGIQALGGGGSDGSGTVIVSP